MAHITDQANACVAALHPYQPGKPVSELQRELGLTRISKLASNENPLGPSPLVAEAIRGELTETARYPDGNGFALKTALAAKHGVELSQITLGNGSNDVLDIIARVFLGPERSGMFSQYGFAVYPISIQAVGANAQVIPAKDYGHDLDAMLAQIDDSTRVVFIANPNNPTGTSLGVDAIDRFLHAVPDGVVVVLDEAYIEYTDSDFPDGTRWLANHPNLIVTRTFSKAYGLASMRVGYALSSAAIADLLNRVRQPFNVNSIALAAACAALCDADFLSESVALNTQGMAQFEAGFSKLGLDWIPSVGNFITVDLGRDAAPLFDALLALGVIVRPVGNYGLPNHLRISIGTEEENAHCIEALTTVLAG